MRKHEFDKENQIRKAIESIKNVAKKLRKTPTIKEYKRSNPTISYDMIQYLFGSWNKAVTEAGLKPNPTRKPPDVSYSKEEVIREIIRVANKLGCYPSGSKFQAKSKMSTSPVKDYLEVGKMPSHLLKVIIKIT